PLIDQILDLVWDRLFPGGFPGGGDGKNICDPALGCGYFPLRLVERLLAGHPSRLPDIRRWAANHLYGADSDAGALFMAKTLLWLALSGRGEEFIPPPGRFRLGDSLLGPGFAGIPGFGTAAHPDGAPIVDWPAAFPEIAAGGGFDIMVGNPPYEALTNFRRRPERERLARALRQSGHYRYSLHGQVNLYRCFIERALDLLRPGGVLALVVPLSLARDASSLPLRRRLLESEAADDWSFFPESDRLFAGVTQSLCVFRAVRGGGGAGKLRIRQGGAVREWSLAKKNAWGGDPILPFPDEAENDLCAWLRSHCRTSLGEAADLRVGEVDQTVYRDCMLAEDSGCLLARGTHLSPFRLDLDPAPGKARFLDRERFLAMRGGMAEAVAGRAARFRVVQLGIRNMLSRPRLIAALAPPGVFIGNSLNVLVPKGGLPLESLAGLLNSRLLDRLFRLGSGNNNINLAEVRRLPFPEHPDPVLALAVADAYRLCAAFAKDAPADLADARGRLDAAVEDFYRLPADLRKILAGQA
ncbi:MAG: Eco57I restriction-modification methylase domain-containing protein, partial [Planctomycetota bacterium]|nr:Eco57I restriction-modification methylase domain-containing protein [Planctomycetota bacterium]